MKKITKLIILLFLPVQVQAGYHAGKLVLKKDFTKVIGSFETDYRYNQTGKYYRHYDFGFAIPFKKTWSAGANYRVIYVLKNGKWQLEKRPHMQIKKTFTTKPLKIALRTRLEYRYRHDDTESARNRTKLSLKSQARFLKIKPFISNEWFYDLDQEKYNKNWLAVGGEFPNSKLGRFSIYYKHVTDLEDDNSWSSSYSIVGKLLYKF